MLKLTTNLLVVLIAIFALAVINLITVFTYRQIQELREANDWVIHTHEVIETSEKLLKNVLLIETSGRAFLLTGDKKYIIEYNKYKNIALNNLIVLKEFTQDNIFQENQIAEFESLLNNRLILLDNAVNLKQKNLLSSKTLIDEINKSSQLIEKLSETDNKINEEEKRLLRVRNDTVNAHSKNVEFYTMFGDALSILILIGGLIMLINQLRLRTLAENKLHDLAYHDILTGLVNRFLPL